ncbi:MAG: addiction module antitoxin RelB [Terriglobia bacterium]|nr:MAG: addiction module antitoxin RelB [Terriglobia bacterium]
MRNAAEVLQDALLLEVRDRATLVQELLTSLEDLSEQEAELLWAEEAMRRLEQYRGGRAAGISAEEVARKAETLFR